MSVYWSQDEALGCSEWKGNFLCHREADQRRPGEEPGGLVGWYNPLAVPHPLQELETIRSWMTNSTEAFLALRWWRWQWWPLTRHHRLVNVCFLFFFLLKPVTISSPLIDSANRCLQTSSWTTSTTKEAWTTQTRWLEPTATGWLPTGSLSSAMTSDVCNQCLWVMEQDQLNLDAW